MCFLRNVNRILLTRQNEMVILVLQNCFYNSINYKTMLQSPPIGINENVSISKIRSVGHLTASPNRSFCWYYLFLVFTVQFIGAAINTMCAEIILNNTPQGLCLCFLLWYIKLCEVYQHCMLKIRKLYVKYEIC